MSKPNLLNDLAFKFVFGQDTKEANQALKGILEVFLNQKIHKVQVKNPELITTSEEMKNACLNLLVELMMTPKSIWKCRQLLPLTPFLSVPNTI